MSAVFFGPDSLSANLWSDAAGWDSLLPCGGGMRRGGVRWTTAVPHGATPTPQGGGEEFAATANRNCAPLCLGWATLPATVITVAHHG
jgi:hypothetical protein